MAYIGPINHWPWKKSPPELSPLQSANNATPNVVSLPKCPWFSAQSLAVDGKLAARLKTTMPHMPVIPPGNKGNHACQLHRWANKEQTCNNMIPPGARQHVMRCKQCQVNICLQCWESYHTKEDLKKKLTQ